VLAVDVRAPEAFQAGRLPGAQSIPLTALTARQGELPPDRLVVLYGADSVDEAAAAFRYLRSTGRTNIFVLEGGFAAWRTGGYRVERLSRARNRTRDRGADRRQRATVAAPDRAAG
jgi:rhodanese-related sulfurtransferase